MNQQAIRVTYDNVSEIVKGLNDGTTAADILDESIYMLDNNINVVLVRIVDFVEDDRQLSHIVSESMFYSNATTEAPLNDTVFVHVAQL